MDCKLFRYFFETPEYWVLRNKKKLKAKQNVVTVDIDP